MRKRAPENLFKALRMFSELPLGPSDYFWTPRTKAQTLIVSNVLQCATVTVGHQVVVPSTNFCSRAAHWWPLVKVRSQLRGVRP